MKKVSINKFFNICNFYIILWLLYNFHWNAVGIFFPVINTFSNLFLAFNLVISLYYTYVVLDKYPLNPFFQVSSILILLFVIYGLFSIVQGAVVVKANTGGTIKSGTYMIGALRTFLPIYVFFLFSKRGYITERTMRIWFWVFLAQTLLIYMLFRITIGADEMDEFRTNNRGYLFVHIFPFVFLFRKHPYIQYALIFIFLLGALLSIKRGAILVTCLATFFFLWNQLKNVSVRKKGFAIIAILVIVVYGTQFVERMYENSIVVQHRFDKTMDGNVSGRDVIANNLWEIYSRSDIFHIFFGFGADGTLEYGNYAHNDWLEMLFDQGLLGLTVYFAFWFIFFSLWREEKRKKTDIAFFLGLIFVCSFPKTLFSMWYSMTNMFVTMPLGYCIAQIYGGHKNFNIKKRFTS